jgi:hypothetical protein
MQLERESSAERCRTTRCNASASLTSTPPLDCQSLCGFAVVCWFGTEAALRLSLGLSPSVVRIACEARADRVSTASRLTISQRVELTNVSNGSAHHVAMPTRCIQLMCLQLQQRSIAVLRIESQILILHVVL